MLQNSTMLELGTPLIDFSLPDPASGDRVGPEIYEDQTALLIAFVCNHCPYVHHLAEALARLAGEYRARGLGMIAINANDVETHPADSPEKMVQQASDWNWAFPYLFDESQQVARAYRAACTPDFYLFDAERKLVYRGQFDDSRPGDGKPITGRNLRQAVDAVLNGQIPSANQVPSAGCNIKWRPGNEPDYFG